GRQLRHGSQHVIPPQAGASATYSVSWNREMEDGRDYCIASTSHFRRAVLVLYWNSGLALAHELSHIRNRYWSRTRSDKEQQLTFVKHEEKKFEEKSAITLDGLLWLANHTEISPSSRDALIILIKELTEVPALTLMDEAKMKEAPWKAIFET
ncbi:4521_t:CDS:2, partial [Acaulospora colombiana]